LYSKYLISAICLLGVSAAHAADPRACETTIATRLQQDAADRLLLDNPETIQLEAGRVEAQLGDKPGARLSGGIVLRRADKLAGADTAIFDGETQSLFLQDNVRFEDPSTQVLSDSAEFQYESGRIAFNGAQFSLGESNSRGAAEQLQIDQQGLLQLDNVSYTTCPPGSNDWLVEAADIDLDTRSGVGTARGMKLRFQGVPILYAPYLSFPITDARTEPGQRENPDRLLPIASIDTGLVLEHCAQLRCDDHAATADRPGPSVTDAVPLPHGAARWHDRCRVPP
jgi:lipopolysaccharide assembly outer membrane protein LptD (OstA)